jgi:hypothetical protein
MLLIGVVNFEHPVELPFHARCLAAAEVTLHPFRAHNLAICGDFKSPLGSLVRFQLLLRHVGAHPLSRVDSASLEADS